MDEHIENLAIQKAGGWAPSHDTFIEGYGKLSDFGVKLKTLDTIAFIEG